jgi:hypothetical protein
MFWGGKFILSKNDTDVNRDVPRICTFSKKNLKMKQKGGLWQQKHQALSQKQKENEKNEKYFKKSTFKH